jgi:hypothetical protein
MTTRSHFRPTRLARGAGIVEFLVAAPLLILLGLGLVQTGMVFHAKSSLDFALQEGARIGAVNYGDVDAIGRGIRQGLVPFMGGGTSDAERARTRLRVEQEFALGSAAGWIRVRQLSPTQQSFSDWAIDTHDEQGNRVQEIPNANLAVLRCHQPPNGNNISGRRASSACPNGGEPVGATSQQTLADANLLKLNLTYGVKMSVPVVNRIVAGVLSMAAGCRANQRQRLGALDLGEAPVDPQPDACVFYNAVDERGRAAPRLPVNLSVTVRMQTPSRFNGSGSWFARQNRGRDANTSGQQLGNGSMMDASYFAPIPVSQLNPMGVTLAQDRYNDTGDGSVHFGSNTDWLGAPRNPGGGGVCTVSPTPIPPDQCSAQTPCQSPVPPRSPVLGATTVPRGTP